MITAAHEVELDRLLDAGVTVIESDDPGLLACAALRGLEVHATDRDGRGYGRGYGRGDGDGEDG